MRVSHRFRTALIAFAAVAGLALTAPAARADSGSISFSIIKAGIVIGGSAGNGVLVFHGRRYPISIGGISYGFTFGASETRFHGTVSHIRRASDVAGVYAAAGMGVALGAGVRGILLTNQNGAVLELSGKQIGLMANVDLSGLAITLKE